MNAAKTISFNLNGIIQVVEQEECLFVARIPASDISNMADLQGATVSIKYRVE